MDTHTLNEEQLNTVHANVVWMENYFRGVINDPKQDVASQDVACEMVMWSVSVREILNGLKTDIQYLDCDSGVLGACTELFDTVREQVNTAVENLTSMGVLRENWEDKDHVWPH